MLDAQSADALLWDLQEMAAFAGALGAEAASPAQTSHSRPLRPDVPVDCLPFAIPPLPLRAPGAAETIPQKPDCAPMEGCLITPCVTAAAWAQRLANGQTTSVDIVKRYLHSIQEKNPLLNAYLEVFAEEALESARESDRRRLCGQCLSPLDGVPIAVKDNIAMQGHVCSCASRMLEGYVSPYDAEVITRVKAAGMPILGRLNMDEFAMGSTTAHSAFGCTRNPHDLSRTPGGSGGGGAAAVAADMTPLALGSDTGGSVRQPAAHCGVVGVKPAYGAVSRWGLVAFASSLDQIGVNAQTAEDAAMLLRIIVGVDERDRTCDPTLSCDFAPTGVQGMRLGLLEADDATKQAAERFRALGAEVQEVALPMLRYALPAYYVISSAEAGSNLARYDGVRYGHRAAAYEGVEALYRKSRAEGFGSEVQRRILLGAYVLSRGYQDKYYLKAQAVREALTHQAEQLLTQVDALLMPVSPTVAPPLGETLRPVDLYKGDLYTVPANLTGLPAVSFPLQAEGLPVGVGLMGRRDGLAALLSLAEAYRKGEAR